jgi:hypothetical protein
MRQHHFLSFTICAAALALVPVHGADAPSSKANPLGPGIDAPALTAAIPDGARSSQRFNDGIYGKIWNSPEFAPLKAKLNTLPHMKIDISSSSAVDPMLPEILQSFSSGQFVFADLLIQNHIASAPSSAMPSVRISYDSGPALANHVAELIRKQADQHSDQITAISVPGATNAFSSTDNVAAALFGAQWVFTNDAKHPGWLAPVKPTPSEHDAVFHAWPAIWADLLPKLLTDANQLAQAQGFITWLKQHPGTIDADADLVKGGVHSHVAFPGSSVALAPVDRAALAPLPATTLWSLAVGLDGTTWWDKERSDAFTRIGALETPVKTAAQIEADLDRTLKQIDPSLSAKALITGLKGTTVLALMQGMPFPTAALTLPRSAALDQLITLTLSKQGMPAPADNVPTIIPLPLPISLSLVKTGTHWLITTDPALAGTWGNGQPGGWLDSPAAKAGLAKAGSDAWLVGLSNTAMELKTWTGFAAMGLNQAKDLTPQERQSALATLNLASKLAQPGWCVARSGKDRTDMECEGLTGGVVIPAIIAAIAVPNVMESRVTANEASAAFTLKSGFFAAEVQFQAGGYIDQDGDKIGEFGLIQELSGAIGTPKIRSGSVTLLTDAFRSATPEKDGYRYALYLPDGKSGAISDTNGIDSTTKARIAKPLAANEQEQHFIVYAWPKNTSSGRRIFAITQDGMVRYAPTPFTGTAPTWNAAFGGKGWNDPVTWKSYTR